MVTLIHDDHCCAYQTFQALKQIKNEYLKNPKIVKYSGTVLINTDVFLLHAFIILYEILIKQPWPPPPHLKDRNLLRGFIPGSESVNDSVKGL